jgi:putative tryptophan/tyrosine transport system substrate-binding protein
MRRRAFLLLAGGAIAAFPRLGAAQQAAPPPLVAVLNPGLPIGAASEPQGVTNIRLGLADLGYVDGQTVRLVARWSGGDNRRLPALAAELAALKPAVIVANGEPAIRAAKDASGTIPIVMSVVGDPVAAGFAQSLAHPGANLTGMSNLSEGLVGKRLELLLELVPKPGCIAVLHNPGAEALDRTYTQEADKAAETFRVRLPRVAATNEGELSGAFVEAAQLGCGALLELSDAVFTSTRSQIIALAAQQRIPAIYDVRWFVDDGGLISYGPDLDDMVRRSALYVDKILRGAKPGDLPIERPSKFELVINLKTAKALGLTVPQSLLARADEVIE